MMISNMDKEKVKEEDLVEVKEGMEEARVEVIRVGLDGMIVEHLDTLQMSAPNAGGECWV